MWRKLLWLEHDCLESCSGFFVGKKPLFEKSGAKTFGGLGLRR